MKRSLLRAGNFVRLQRRYASTIVPPKYTPLRNGDSAKYSGVTTKYTDNLEFRKPRNIASFDTYRVYDEDGVLLNKNYKLSHSPEHMLKMYKSMVTLSIADQIMYDAQRQGRISFYMTCIGEEATHIGSAEPLTLDDVLYLQYREFGTLLWRGFTLQQMADQCFSNVDDLGKGRQMPVHYGSRELNVQTVSSPLTTQVPQASGAAYALKLEKKDAVCVCYFGDGAASEGDFHPAMNFAATLNCPVLFFCRNNDYAISTSTADQYNTHDSDGIAGRGPGYGIITVRVDGNDILAVSDVVRGARKLAVKENRPVLIEAMTYRGGHHSTSDDSTRYRDTNEIRYWSEVDHPIRRFKRFLTSRQLIDDKEDQKLHDDIRLDVLTAFANAEKKLKPPVSDLFSDIYEGPVKHLDRQKEENLAHIRANKDHYRVDEIYSGGI